MKGNLNTTLALEYIESYKLPQATGEVRNITVDDEDMNIAIYEDKKIDTSKKLDLHFAFNLKIDEHKMALSTDILNLLNDVQKEQKEYVVECQVWMGLEYVF